MNVSRRKVKLLLMEIKGFHRHLALASLVSSYYTTDLFSQSNPNCLWSWSHLRQKALPINLCL